MSKSEWEPSKVGCKSPTVFLKQRVCSMHYNICLMYWFFYKKCLKLSVCVCVCVCVLVAQSCPTFCNSMDYIAHQAPLSLGFSSQEYRSSGHCLLQGSSRPRDGTWVSCIPGRFFTVRATREVPYSEPSFSSVQFSSGQSLSHVRLFATPQIAAGQASLSITNSRSLLTVMSIESVMPFSHLILYCPLLLLPPIPPSIRVFSNKSPLRMRRPKYWSFSFNISPSSECPGLISFRMDWLDLLAVQGTLKSLLQHHSQHHQFFGTQLSSQFNSHIHTRPLKKP